MSSICCIFFFSRRKRHTRCALVTGVRTCALPIYAVSKRSVVSMEFADEYTRLRYEESLSAREAAEESGATPERLADIDAFAPLVSSDRPSDILDHALLTEIGMLDEAAQIGRAHV